MRRLSSWIAVGLAGIVVAILIVVSAGNWIGIGNAGISVNGWVALVLGVVATLAVGGGLMALVFISSRRGYDEPPSDRDQRP